MSIPTPVHLLPVLILTFKYYYMRYNKLIFSLALLLTMFSCKKVLEVDETNLIAGDNAFLSVGNCEQGVIGAYAILGTEMNILLNSTFSDEVKKSEFYNAATTHEWQYSSQDIGIRDNFTALTPNYQIIDRVNRVLEALPEADSLKASDNAALRARVKGEALFLRAYAHFELFRYYCNNYHPDNTAMPYLEAPTMDYQERIKMGPYFEKLKADMAEASTLLPNNLTDVNRATRLAAIGLQARVALYMKDWSNAATFSTAYITGLPLAPRASFQGIWTDANAQETAFRLVRNTTLRIGSLFRAVSANASNIGTVTWQPSNKLWNSFDQANDIRFSTWLKDEPILANGGRPSHIIQKYAGTGYATTNENVANGKVFRTGEMYLIRAEARAESGAYSGANSAESDINELRAARITGYTPETFASKEAAIEAVLNERFKELAFEGHRFWDLKRRELPVERPADDAPNTNSAVLPAKNFRFVLPIPDWEVKANKLMQQNFGYF
jgi:hypothetical protein